MSASPSPSVIVITEEALLPVDVAHIRSVTTPDTTFSLLVATGTDRNTVADFLDHLALLDLKEAWEDLTGQNDIPEDLARSDARQVLDASSQAMTDGGAEVTSGEVVDDVMAELRSVVAQDVQQIIAVTEPSPVEDTFHTSWADKAEEAFGIPVLHLYRGTSEIGS